MNHTVVEVDIHSVQMNGHAHAIAILQACCLCGGDKKRGSKFGIQTSPFISDFLRTVNAWHICICYM